MVNTSWFSNLKYETVGGHQRISREIGNVVTILQNDERWKGVLAYNEFTSKIEARKPPSWGPEAPGGDPQAGPWVDSDDTRLQIWFQREYSLRFSAKDLAAAVQIVAESNRYHPVKEYLASLQWDGVSRLDGLFARYFGSADTPYARLVGRWWMISAVARVFKPGIKVDYAIVLEGSQGKKKSTALRKLAVRPEWFFDSSLPIGDKDSFQVLRGKWIIEVAELDGFKRTEERKLKSYITSAVDSYRSSFGRHTQDHPRQCVFAGSTNEDHYLEDPTGGRRFWPVRCGEICIDDLENDVPQLWAEAVSLFLRGERWWPETPAEHAAAAVEQEDRYQGDEWEPVISAWLKSLDPVTEDYRAVVEGRLTIGMVLQALKIEPDKWDKAKTIRVGSILKRLKFVRDRRMENGVRSYFYSPPAWFGASDADDSSPF